MRFCRNAFVLLHFQFNTIRVDLVISTVLFLKFLFSLEINFLTLNCVHRHLTIV